jgi:hypothetical protein
MRKWIPRLCVENSRDSRLHVDCAGELLHLICRASAALSADGRYGQCEKPASETANAGVPS